MERDGLYYAAFSFAVISTHSLRVERDSYIFLFPIEPFVFQPTLSVWRETATFHSLNPNAVISTHSLRVERDTKHSYISMVIFVFQPTLSVWRETPL